MSRVAIFPGSFDPMTNAHLDVARRAASLFDRLIIGVLNNTKKTPVFEVAERVALIEASVADVPGVVEVTAFEGLTVEFARQHRAGFIVRGLRAVSDFEAELQMVHTNRKLAEVITGLTDLDAVRGIALEYGYLSSTLAKEVAQFGGDISGMVPGPVAAGLRARFGDASRRGRPAGL